MREQHTLTHETFEYGCPLFRRIEQRRIDAPTRPFAKLVLLIAQRLAEFQLGNFVVSYGRNALRVTFAAKVRVDPEQRKRRDDQHEEADHDPFSVFRYEIEHVNA